MLCAYLDIYFF